MADLVTDNEIKAFGDGLNSGAKFAKWVQSLLKNKQNESNILKETEELSNEVAAKSNTLESNILDEIKEIEEETQQVIDNPQKIEPQNKHVKYNKYTKIPLDLVLLANGYEYNKDKTTLNNQVLKHPSNNDIIIVSKNGSNYVYKNTNNSKDKGSIWKFCKNRNIKARTLIENYNKLYSQYNNEPALDKTPASKTIEEEIKQPLEETQQAIDNPQKIEESQNLEIIQEEIQSNEKIETTHKDNSNSSNFKDNFLEEKEALQNEINKIEANKTNNKDNNIKQDESNSKPSLFSSLEIYPKEEFTEKFLKYSKTMNEDEIKALGAVLNKNPSKLTKEDKKLIVEGLKIAVLENDNFKHLNPAFHSLIKSNAGIKSSTKEIDSLLSFDTSKAKNPIDKVLLKHALVASIDKVKNVNNEKLGIQENKALDSIKANFQNIKKNASQSITIAR